MSITYIAIDTERLSVEAKGDLESVYSELSQHYSMKEIQENVEIFELGNMVKINIVGVSEGIEGSKLL